MQPQDIKTKTQTEKTPHIAVIFVAILGDIFAISLSSTLGLLVYSIPIILLNYSFGKKMARLLSKQKINESAKAIIVLALLILMAAACYIVKILVLLANRKINGMVEVCGVDFCQYKPFLEALKDFLTDEIFTFLLLILPAYLVGHIKGYPKNNSAA